MKNRIYLHKKSNLIVIIENVNGLRKFHTKDTWVYFVAASLVYNGKIIFPDHFDYIGEYEGGY